MRPTSAFVAAAVRPSSRFQSSPACCRRRRWHHRARLPCRRFISRARINPHTVAAGLSPARSPRPREGFPRSRTSAKLNATISNDDYPFSRPCSSPQRLLSPHTFAQQTLQPPPHAKVIPLNPAPGRFTEPSIAVNPKNPNQIAAAFQVPAGIAYSEDRGETWQIAKHTAPENYRVSGDVSITYDFRGHAILCYIAFDKLGTSQYWAHNATRNGIFVRRSLDGGKTWEANAISVDEQPTRRICRSKTSRTSSPTIIPARRTPGTSTSAGPSSRWKKPSSSFRAPPTGRCRRPRRRRECRQCQRRR